MKNFLDIINSYLPKWWSNVSPLYNTDGSLKTMWGTKTPIMGVYDNNKFYMTPKYYANKRNTFNSWWDKEIQPSISGNIIDDSNSPTYNTDLIRAQRAQKGGYSNADEFINYLVNSPESNEAKLFAQAGFTDEKGNLDKAQISTLLNERGIRKNLGRRDSGRLADILTQLQKQAKTGTAENHAFMEAAVNQYNTNYAGKANQEDEYVLPTLKYDRTAGKGNELSMINSEGKEIGTNVGFDKNPNNYENKASEFINKKFINMNRPKFQEGGAAPQGDPQEQIIQLVQAAMQGDQQATAQIQQIMQAAQQGDQQAGQIAEMIMQIMNQMQGGAPQVARNGAKLNYIKKLKGECPEGYEMAYFKAGGKVCKKCQKKVEKACGGTRTAKCGTKFHKAGGVMESILSEMFAKGGAMNRNKHTAFGEERGANVVSTNHAGRWGGRRAFNANGTHNLNPHDKPNKFSAFGDEGKKKPTNVGLVGHKATGKTGRMQNRQKAGTTYKGTAFGGEKQKRFHRGAKASSIGRIGSISGYPKGQWGKSGIGRI